MVTFFFLKQKKFLLVPTGYEKWFQLFEKTIFVHFNFFLSNKIISMNQQINEDEVRIVTPGEIITEDSEGYLR